MSHTHSRVHTRRHVKPCVLVHGMHTHGHVRSLQPSAQTGPGAPRAASAFLGPSLPGKPPRSLGSLYS